MQWNVYQAGIIEVRYERSEDLTEEAQAPVLEAIKRQGRPTALLFDARHTHLDSRALNFWVDQLDELGPALSLVGIIDETKVVRLLAGAFAIAANLRRHSVRLEVFDAPGDAVTWALRAINHVKPRRAAEWH